MTEIALAVALIGITTLHVWTVWQHKAERSELLTRIMAKDLREYQDVTNTRPPPKGGNFIKAGLKRYQEAMIRDAGAD
ncbi:MAG: hypothetical protein M0P69_19445 [Bacteroidales bacterium]|nr:hypothetical protein [Bacteroidales bacterium]